MAGHNYNRYGDNLARKQRRRFFLKLILALFSVLGLAILTVYLAFFSPFLQITEINIEGLRSVKSEDVYPIVESIVNQTVFGPVSIKPQKNIILFDKDIVKEKILNHAASIKNVEIKKEYPHKIIISISERDAIGTWCFNSGQECRYFDDSGVFWGKAVRSFGSLFLLIDDMRTEENIERAEERFISGVKKSLAGLEAIGIRPTQIQIPEGSIDDMHVYTSKGYYLIFSTDSDIEKQIEVLRIFLDNQSAGFNPSYIDLRIEGRVYYK